MGGLFSNSKSTNTAAPVINGIRIQTSAYGLVIPFVCGLTRITGNLIWYGDYTAIAVSKAQTNTAGKGGMQSPSSSTWNYFVAVCMGLCEGPITDIYSYWVDKEYIDLHPQITAGGTFTNDNRIAIGYWNGYVSSYGINIFKGTYPQAPWSYLSSNHHTQAVPYPGLAYFATSNWNLGDQPSLPNFTFLVAGLFPYYDVVIMSDETYILPDAVTITDIDIIPGSSPYEVAVDHVTGWVEDVSVYNTGTTISVSHTVNDGVYTFATAYAGSAVDITYKYVEPIPVTISIYEIDNFVSDIGVNFATSGTALTRVVSSPGTNEYSESNGVYTFSKWNYNRSIEIDYNYQIVVGSNPRDIFQGVWINDKYGFSLATSKIYSLDNYSDYCIASNFFISPAIVEQENARDIFTRWLMITNSELVWSEGKFKIIPYGDTEINSTTSVFIESFYISSSTLTYVTVHTWEGNINVVDISSNKLDKVLSSPGNMEYTVNNGTYVFSSLNVGTEVLINYHSSDPIDVIGWSPDLTPLYDLTINNFLVNEGDPPIVCTRNTPQDAYNHIQIEFLNEDNEYNPETSEYKDQANIEDYGLKTSSVLKFHEITSPEMAMAVAQIICNRKLYNRNTYEFNLGWKYCLLEPMDYVTITEEGLGLYRQLVRITEVEEVDDRTLKIIAEEVSVGTAHPAVYSSQSASGSSQNQFLNPGTANTPIVFVPPLALTTDPEIWMATAGGNNWGGCDVWISQDNSTYKRVGTKIGNCRYGSLSTSLATGITALDTLNTLKVDLTDSKGALSSAATVEVDSLRTLCYADGEYLSYKDATLTSSYNYDLDYLIRGCYGSGMQRHESGSSFVRLDDAVFKYPIERSDIGTTIYIKLQSFNYYGKMFQSLSDVNAYSYEIDSPGDESIRAVGNLQIVNNSNSPTTKINVSFDLCDMQNSVGSVYTANGQGFTIDFSINGVNGIDSSLATSSWYYLYSIANGTQRLVGGLGSTSFATPLFPYGYDYKRLIGVAETDSVGELKSFVQSGSEWSYPTIISVSTGTSAQNWIDVDCSSHIPPICTRAWFSLQMTNSSTCNFGLRTNGTTTNDTQTAPPGVSQMEGWVNTDTNQVIELYIENPVDYWILFISGLDLNI